MSDKPKIITQPTETQRLKNKIARLKEALAYYDQVIKGFDMTNDKLRTQRDELLVILKPFAEFQTLIDITRNETTITFQDFLKAKQAIAKEGYK